jgi:hypothetical protein
VSPSPRVPLRIGARLGVREASRGDACLVWSGRPAGEPGGATDDVVDGAISIHGESSVHIDGRLGVSWGCWCLGVTAASAP